MKLIKINAEHYIVVDDSEIKEGDWFYYKHFGEDIISQAKETTDLTNLNNPDKYFKKITHSTEPLNDNPHYADYGIITLREVKELIGEVDVEKKAEILYCFAFGGIGNLENSKKEHWIKGYNQALEDNKEKKYTEEDILDAWELGAAVGLPLTKDKKEKLFQSLQPKTEWEVKFDENGKLKLV